MEVWKDPNCGCCKDWIALMEKAGFAVTVHDSGNSAVRAKLGLPPNLGSCHTPWWAAIWSKAMCLRPMCTSC
jgi:hypothetical protein